tara:strand:- start:143603 stop:144418 length:816 start_codon:yes stop_codon:yes gene_type:complete
LVSQSKKETLKGSLIAVISQIKKEAAGNFFGLIVIGDEILNGRRSDKHFEGIGNLIRSHGYKLKWCRFLPDDPGYLTNQLRVTMAENTPVFVCGGIGATTDDHTRQCAAEAASVSLVRHPEAASEIEKQFGDKAFPRRICMADLPKGSVLIPNTYNRISGFSINNHYFLPGFPKMAWSMASWVLNEYFPKRSPEIQKSVWIESVTETVLSGVMDDLAVKYPNYKLFCLPRLGETPKVELGFRGGSDIEEPYKFLLERLCLEGFKFTENGIS